jgi:hypothetical protein
LAVAFNCALLSVVPYATAAGVTQLITDVAFVMVMVAAALAADAL